MTARLSRRLLLACAAALPSCSVLPAREYQERREWPLDVPPPAAAAGVASPDVLLLRALRAGPGLDTRGLRSIQPDGAERIDHWEEWAVPPPQGVGEALRQWLIASGRFAAVVMPGSQVPYQLVLEGELLALVADPQAGDARAALSLVLLRQTHGEARPLLQRSFAGVAPLRGKDGRALADAMRLAVADMLTQVLVAVTQLA